MAITKFKQEIRVGNRVRVRNRVRIRFSGLVTRAAQHKNITRLSQEIRVGNRVRVRKRGSGRG
jgi:hypothetical protein